MFASSGLEIIFMARVGFHHRQYSLSVLGERGITRSEYEALKIDAQLLPELLYIDSGEDRKLLF